MAHLTVRGQAGSGYACAVSAHECEISSTGHGLTHRHRVRRGHLRPRPRACRRRRHPAPGSRRHVVARLGSGASARRQPAPRTPFRALPEHATVVAWDLHESASASDPLSRAVLAPLRDAGFAVDAVPARQTPCVRSRNGARRPPGRAGEVWLALNRQRVAMAIVEDGRLLYSRALRLALQSCRNPENGTAAALFARRASCAGSQARHRRRARGTRRERQRHRHLRRSPGPAIADDAAHRGAGHRSRDPRHAGRRQRRGGGGRRGDRGAGAGDQARVRGGLGIRREWQRALAARRGGSRPACDSGRRMDGDAFTVRVARRSRTAGTIAPVGGSARRRSLPTAHSGTIGVPTGASPRRPPRRSDRRQGRRNRPQRPRDGHRRHPNAAPLAPVAIIHETPQDRQSEAVSDPWSGASRRCTLGAILPRARGARPPGARAALEPIADRQLDSCRSGSADSQSSTAKSFGKATLSDLEWWSG